MGNKPDTIQFDSQQWTKCPTVGQGSFGKVFVVENDGKYRCIKEISKQSLIAKSDSSLTLLLQERIFLSELRDCPFVVQVHGTFQDKDYLYIMMDYCEGGELFWHLQLQPKKRFSEEVAKFYLAELIISIKTMHKMYRIIHRDIKPQNILLTKDGHLTLIDFNVAIRCDDDGLLQNPEKKKVGTLSYMAPEILSGSEIQTCACDWWSVGVVIYQLLRGSTPWQTSKEKDRDQLDRAKDFLTQIQSSPIDSKLKGCSNGMRLILNGLCDPNPKTRFNGVSCQKSEYFSGWNWRQTRERSLISPFTPGPKTFDEILCVGEVLSGPKPKPPPITPAQQAKFSDWDWMAPKKVVPLPEKVVSPPPG